ncbi:hypothetical protein FM104_03785 [Microbacterium esteraromaticum]|uniref:Uncharacterized protein n=1 Tax=Microbacterium esteraromaticum TaxID=57043 RepID=A0A1R4IST7_9MICO|nr:hypothetical protein FM104_03785 [Microbacterium esteraromaticum]
MALNDGKWREQQAERDIRNSRQLDERIQTDSPVGESVFVRSTSVRDGVVEECDEHSAVDAHELAIDVDLDHLPTSISVL